MHIDSPEFYLQPWGWVVRGKGRHWPNHFLVDSQRIFPEKASSYPGNFCSQANLPHLLLESDLMGGAVYNLPVTIPDWLKVSTVFKQGKSGFRNVFEYVCKIVYVVKETGRFLDFLSLSEHISKVLEETEQLKNTNVGPKTAQWGQAACH